MIKEKLYNLLNRLKSTENNINNINSNITGLRSDINTAASANYAFYKWPSGAVNLNSSTPTLSHTLSITTKRGNPVFLCVCGDNNPTTATTWFNIEIYRGSTKLCHQIDESHANSWNIPFNLCYLDVVSKGTYSYEARITRGARDANLNESGVVQAPQFIVFEI